jgi:RNA polymerase sigma-70 factor (ECF subfamily)
MSDISTQIEAQIPRLRRYALVLTRHPSEADELVQDCLVRALSKVHLWEGGTNLNAWLFTIMHNQYVNKLRQRSREGTSVPVGEDEPLLTHAAPQGTCLELRDLDRALSQLPQEARTLVLLIGLEGMSYQAVSDVFGVPIGTIRSRLSRARAQLRRQIGVPYEQSEGWIAA